MKKQNKTEMHSGIILVSEESNIICMSAITGKQKKDKEGKTTTNCQLFLPLTLDNHAMVQEFPNGGKLSLRKATPQEAAEYLRALAEYQLAVKD